MATTKGTEASDDSKVIADPVHDTMIFKSYIIKIIDHPYFQRLRYIKQLQGVDHVYPGGDFSRFSHSLGVCYLAGQVLDRLEKGFELEKTDGVSDFDRKCVTIAALCHDIGHGPFSHLYEKISKEIDKCPCTHEDRSREITEYIIDDLSLFANQSESDLAKQRIGDMIKGKKIENMTAVERKKAFLYQIVNNKDYGIDVDKWDYLLRDSHACGFQSNFDKPRAIAMLKVSQYKHKNIEARVLSFPIKDQINLYNMFLLRFTLHNKVYQHTVVRCVEEMISDVLKFTDNIKFFKGNYVSPKECRVAGAIENYCLMDDRLLYLIYHAVDSYPVINDIPKNNTGNLAVARAIIDRIHKRDFYQCIYSESHPQWEKIVKDKKNFEKILEQRFFEYVQEKRHQELLNEIKSLENTRRLNGNIQRLFRITIKKVNYGNGDRNPIPNVYFYEKGINYVITTKGTEKSPMVPSCFEEVTVLVICTLTKTNFDCLDIQWKEFINSVFGFEEEMQPPRRKKKKISK